MQMYKITPTWPGEAESEIVWCHDPALFPHVREAFVHTSGRSRAITLNESDGRVLIGYATLKPEFSGLGMRRYRRRFFYIMPYDFDGQDRLRPPMEAVDPLTIAAGQQAHETERCYTPPTPKQREAIRAILAAQQAKLNAKREAATARQQKHRQPDKERATTNAKRRAKYAKKVAKFDV
jgi:hypothetical protein